MFDQQPSTLYQTVARLGSAVGIGAAIYVTPLLFGWKRAAVAGYLTANFGREAAPYLLWATGALIAYVVYVVCKALITFALTWVMTALAARGLDR